MYDVDWLPKFKISVIESGSGVVVAVLNSDNWLTSANVNGVTDESGMDANVVVAVGIELQVRLVQYLFSFPVLLTDILIFGSRPTSGNVDSVISESDMVESMGVEVVIVASNESNYWFHQNLMAFTSNVGIVSVTELLMASSKIFLYIHNATNSATTELLVR